MPEKNHYKVRMKRQNKLLQILERKYAEGRWVKYDG